MNKLTTLVLVIGLSLFIGGCNGKKASQDTKNAEALKEQLALAEQYLDDGKAEEALELYEQLVGKHPEHVGVVEATAFAQQKVGDASLAAFYFEQLMSLDSNRKEVAIFAGNEYREVEDWDSAKRCYEIYLKAYPQDDQAWKAMSDILQKRGDVQESVVALEKAFQLGITSASDELLEAAAKYYEEKGNLLKAKEWYEVIIDNEPESVNALLAVLNLDLELENLEDAMAKYDAIKRIDGFEIDADLVKTVEQALYPDLEQQQEEVADKLEEAMEQLESMGKPLADAEMVDTKSTEVEEQEPEVVVRVKAPMPVKKAAEYFKDAETAYKKGDYKESIENYWKGLTQKPKEAEAWYRLAQVYFAGQDYSQAETTALEATRLDAESLRYRLAYLKAIQANRSSAELMVELEKAHSAFPQSPDITLSLAKAYDKIEGNTRNARQMYEQFLKQAPNHKKSAEAKAWLLQN